MENIFLGIIVFQITNHKSSMAIVMSDIFSYVALIEPVEGDSNECLANLCDELSTLKHSLKLGNNPIAHLM